MQTRRKSEWVCPRCATCNWLTSGTCRRCQWKAIGSEQVNWGSDDPNAPPIQPSPFIQQQTAQGGGKVQPQKQQQQQQHQPTPTWASTSKQEINPAELKNKLEAARAQLLLAQKMQLSEPVM